MTTPVDVSPKAETPWHMREEKAILAELNTTKAGLTAEEAAERLTQYGSNELQEAEPVSPWSIFLRQFSDLIIWILIAAGIVAGVLGEVVDTIAILAIVVLNAVMGFYQEYSAEKSIVALKKMTAPHAKVRRNGKIADVAASEIVPGDVLALESGDIVAADARLLSAASLKNIESALTGESEAVSKRARKLEKTDTPLGDRENMVFMGTSVAAGTGEAVVVATAMQTEIGRIASLIHTAEQREGTPLQEKLAALGRMLVWASLGIVALLFALGLLRGAKFFDMFMTAVSLAVAAVPEGLPAVVTIALALGVVRMSRRRALVRKLPSVETLGSTNVICTDKTGTLTVGEMTVRALYVAGRTFEVTGEGYDPQGDVRFEGEPVDATHAAALLEMANVLIGCNNAHLVLEDDAWKVVGDPTEGAMLSAGHKAGGSKQRLEEEMPKQHEIPFDSDRKRSCVVRLLPNGRLRAFVNGAPDLLVQRCTSVFTESGVHPMTEDVRAQIADRNGTLAAQALRVLGSAYRDLDPTSPGELTADDLERDLTFVGLTGMYDPPRAEAKQAVKKCRSAGIRVVMITGDHPHTAIAIARELGIADSTDTALSGTELDQFSDDELRQRAPQVHVYARVTAEHKLRIIRAWKENDAVVAMTGDGVNDAPAIKGADIGVAMGRSGTEVTKQAADMIITDDNFASIVAAVEEGRGIYDNIRKTLQFLLAGNAGELLLMTVCIVLGLPTPLLPIHLLWINLVTDGLPALCLATDPIDPSVMKNPPRARRERITDHGFLSRIVIAGIATAGVSFAAYLYALQTATPEVARTYAFTALVFAELLKSFAFRSETKLLWSIKLLSNLNLLIVVLVSLGLQLWILESEFLGRWLKTETIPLGQCGVLLLVCALPFLILEGMKLARGSRSGGHPRQSPASR